MAGAAVAEVEREEVLSRGTAATTGKTHVSAVVLGHVDSGKTTLMRWLAGGHLRLTRGRPGPCGLDTSRREAERDTTLLNRPIKVPSVERDLTVIDTPGLRSLTKHAIAAASQVDVAVLCVSAEVGAFELSIGGRADAPLRQLTAICKVMGVRRVIVAVTHMDTANFDRTRFEQIMGEMTAALAKQQFKSSNERPIHFVPVAMCDGALNVRPECPVDKRWTSGDARPLDWYTGPSVLQALEGIQPPPPTARRHAIDLPLRMTVHRAFKVRVGARPFAAEPWQRKGAMLCVAEGRILSGAVRVGDLVEVAVGDSKLTEHDARPLIGRRGTVRSIERLSSGVDEAVAGDYASLGITAGGPDAFTTAMLNKGIDFTHGDVLGSPDEDAPRRCHSFEGTLLVTNLREVRPRTTEALMHVGTAAVPCVIEAVMSHSKPGAASTDSLAPCASLNVKPRDQLKVLVVCKKPVCVEVKAEYDRLGRVLFTDKCGVIAAGVVERVVREEPRDERARRTTTYRAGGGLHGRSGRYETAWDEPTVTYCGAQSRTQPPDVEQTFWEEWRSRGGRLYTDSSACDGRRARAKADRLIREGAYKLRGIGQSLEQRLGVVAGPAGGAGGAGGPGGAPSRGTRRGARGRAAVTGGASGSGAPSVRVTGSGGGSGGGSAVGGAGAGAGAAPAGRADVSVAVSIGGGGGDFAPGTPKSTAELLTVAAARPADLAHELKQLALAEAAARGVARASVTGGGPGESAAPTVSTDAVTIDVMTGRVVDVTTAATAPDSDDEQQQEV